MRKSLARQKAIRLPKPAYLPLATSLLLAAAMITSAAVAQPQILDNETLIKRFDRNGDGKISKDEWHGVAPFSHFDANGDGYLTLEELNQTRAAGRKSGTGSTTTAFDGHWTGHGVPSSSDCASYFDIAFDIKSGRLSGNLVVSNRSGKTWPSDVAGQVGADGAARLSLTPRGEGAYGGRQAGHFEGETFVAKIGGRNCSYAVQMTKH